MSRLDRHVAVVQNKLFLRRFLEALAWSTLVLAAAALLAVLINIFFRIFVDYFPNFPKVWVLVGGAVACVIVSFVYATLKRPTREQAAAAIDDKLRLKEKFSTAIYVRPSSDPFAMAAVRDAERTAENVQIGKQFPIPLPKPAYTMFVLAALAFAIPQFVAPLDLFGKAVNQPKPPDAQAPQLAAKQAIDRAIAAVDSMPKSAQTTDEFRKLVAQLHDLQKAPKIDDPARANRRALQALQEINNQAAKDWDKAKKFAEAQNSLMQALQPPDDAKGPVGEARKEIAKGNFDAASSKLEEAVKNFDKMDKQAKDDAAKQMEQAAKQLEQLAKDPQLQQQIQQQLQQMGASQAMAQQMQQAMQQAAAGDQKAAQQLQQMAQQMAQQMNNGQGPNQQQQQQMQQAMQQMQAQANAQQQANGLAQAAQQMAQAMQQQGQQQQGGQQQQNPQQAQAMQQAQQGMKQALQNMQGVKQDLQQMAQQQQQAQQAMQQAQQCANGQCQGGAQGQGQKPGQGKNGQFAQGQPPQGQGQGRGGPGQAAGGDSNKAVNPFGTKMEQSPSQDDEKGRILASYMVKDKAEPGVQRMTIQEMVKKAEKDAPDEIDAEHANRAAQKVAQEYFRTMQQDAPAPKK